MLNSVLHSAARSYAQARWPVFPCVPNGTVDKNGDPSKAPATPNGFYDATTDLKQIDEWWATEDWNIGFCPENAGLGVVDVDENGDINLTSPAISTTPHGRHIFLAGSLPSTVSKLAPHVDTRGRDSYVLLPPSVVDGKRYEECWKEVPQPRELPKVPEWVIERLNQPTVTPRKAKLTETDRPKAIKLFKRYLADKPPIGGEEDGDDYAVAARAGDFNLSCETFVALCVEAGGDAEYAEARYINANEKGYRQNEIGCDTPETGQEKFGKLVQSVPTNSTILPAANDWIPHDPRPASEMPELSFFDQDKCIPKSPDGAIGILYGKRGDHKTNTILSLLDMASASRILYAAGEGAYGVERDRINARPTLAGRIKILPRVPLFSDPGQVQAFIDGCNSIGYRPEIVVLDTLATVLMGEDENSSITAGYLTDNGPAGMIKHAWNCTVIVIAHSGKDPSRGVRGSSGFEGNIDFLLQVTANKKARTIALLAEKIRDGEEGHSTYWQYADSGVPVPVKITEREYITLVKPAATEETHPVGMVVGSYLGLHDVKGWTNSELSDALTEQELNRPRLAEPSDPEWDTVREGWRRRLLHARREAWAKKLFKERVEDGGTKMTIRWYSPEPEL